MRYAYLTCELKSRDLDSRLLIADHLLQRGGSVVVGQQWSIMANADTAPPGVFLFKTANRIQGVNIERARQRHKAVAMDEEVFGISAPLLMRMIVDPKVVVAADAFLFHSHEHMLALSASGPIVGNARIDLIESKRDIYDIDIQKCRADGPYILFNSNFTLANSIWGAGQKVTQLMAQSWNFEGLTEAEVQEFVQSRIDTEAANMRLMVDTIRWLTLNRNGHRVVVRPHPAENASAWNALPHIEVVTGSNPIPWILGADLTLHSNSTTGLEAEYLGCPVLNLNPCPDAMFSKNYVTNRGGHQAFSLESAKEKIAAFLAGQTAARERRVPEVFHSARLIAEQVAALAIDGDEIRAWNKLKPSAIKTAKFSVMPDEMRARVAALGITANVKQLDRGVYLLSA